MIRGVYALLLTAVLLGLLLGTRRVLRARLKRWAKRVLLEFRARTDRYKLVQRERIREALLRDPRIEAAIQEHATRQGTDPAQVRRLVQAVQIVQPLRQYIVAKDTEERINPAAVWSDAYLPNAADRNIFAAAKK